jgi:hypothetical protein
MKIVENHNCILFLFICICMNVYAQQPDSLFQYLNLTTTGTYNKTEINRSYLLSNGLNYSIKKNKVKSDLQARWLFGKEQQQLTNNDLYNSFNLNWYKTFPNFNYWLLFNYNSIFSLKVNNQIQYGVGVAYDLIHQANLNFNISDGLIIEHSDIYLVDTLRTVYQVLRNSLRLQLKINFGDRFRFYSVSFLQSSLKDKNDYILKEEGTLSYKMKKWLSLTARFTYDRMNHTGRDNLFMTYGLTLIVIHNS